MSAFTYSDMQWVFVHHLLRNEAVLSSSGFGEYLQRSDTHVEELCKLRNNDADFGEAASEEQEQLIGDDGLSIAKHPENRALVKKLRLFRRQLKCGDLSSREELNRVIDLTKKSVRKVEEAASKWCVVYKQCRQRAKFLRTQLTLVQEIACAIESFAKTKKKAVYTRLNNY